MVWTPCGVVFYYQFNSRGKTGFMKKDKSSTVKIVFLLAIIVIITVVVAFSLNNKSQTPKSTKSTEIELTAPEESTVSMINLVIAKTELRSPQTAHVMYLEQMRDIAKRYNPSTDWFDGSKATFSTKSEKSEKQQIITLSDGSYCAEFTLREDVPLEYTLTNYSFNRKDCPGKSVMFLTTEEIEKLSDSKKE